ncbi:hypothetical protein [Burkholderia sp. Bp8986]|uniref:hypothetical protein n=1 Tax=Burkholderia sp. Bp8986 TaxID=2184550 RepID=UPI001639B7BB|nr:hypothetical protein [Burkholderia sp. Bp8986]
MSIDTVFIVCLLDFFDADVLGETGFTRRLQRDGDRHALSPGPGASARGGN